MRGVQQAQIGPVIWRVLAFSIVGGLAVLLLLTGGAFAGDSPSGKIAALPLAPELQASASARPTVAWVDFCQRVPSECSINLSEPEKIKLTWNTWNTIKAINNRVNRSIISLSDQDHWGVADRWDLPNDGYGDCEDIQLLKRKLLAERAPGHEDDRGYRRPGSRARGFGDAHRSRRLHPRQQDQRNSAVGQNRLHVFETRRPRQHSMGVARWGRFADRHSQPITQRSR